MNMKRAIATANAPAAVGPYSQAIEANGILFISGQIPVDPKVGKIVEGGITEQTEQVLKNIGAILKEAGLDFVPMNEVYAKYFTGDKPARAAFGVVKLPLGAMVEIEAIAVR